MSVCATKACRRPKHKNSVFRRHELSPVQQILSLKKTEIEFGQHKLVACVTIISLKNTEIVGDRPDRPKTKELCLCDKCTQTMQIYKHINFSKHSQ